MDSTWWRSPEQLDADQQKVVALPLTGSHLVVGPPGSGKTNLLLLRATFLARAGRPNIAIITFNRVLREFLVTGAGNYPFEPGRIQTFRTWAVDLLKSVGVSIDTDCDFDVLRGRLLDGLRSLSAEAKDALRLDCILVDEAQDYFVEELACIRQLTNDVFAVGDDNQRIYRAEGSLEYLKTVCGSPESLVFHYRNGMSICRLADGIMNVTDGGMVDTCNYDESKYPSRVSRIGNLAIDQQVTRAVQEIQTQILAYPDEWIGVLAPLRADVKAVFEQLLQSSIGHLVQLQRYHDGYDSLDRSRPIIVTTMHSAKGLEFRATHVFALDNVVRLDHHQRLVYTAITRAKTSLHLYHDGAVPGYLERGLIAVEGAPVRAPGLAELFGDRA